MTTTRPRLLADIGGTNARFAIYDNAEVRDVIVLACRDYPDLASAAHAYLSQIKLTTPPFEASMAVAAPLHGDDVSMTNHVWRFSVAETRRQLSLERLIVLNDFTALAMGLRHLPASELQQIGGHHRVEGAPIALIGPGTGLGVSGLIPHNNQWMPLQGEGGHATLPASTEREAAVIANLRARFKHVSAERVISGPGLVNLYETLCLLDGVAANALTPADITQYALGNRDLQCYEALQLFCAMLGTMASNLVLTLGAVGGLYIGGGIVPSLGNFFARSDFRKRFEDKGRYQEYLAPVPAWLITSATPAFVGLARAFTDPGPRVVA